MTVLFAASARILPAISLAIKIKSETDLGALVAGTIALIALWVAWQQLSTAAIQARASIFLALDQRWETSPLIEARVQLGDFIAEVNEAARKAWELKPQGEWSQYLLSFYANTLDAMRTDPDGADRYNELFLLCGFFETVGFTAHTKHLPAADLVSLFGVSIRLLGDVFAIHIRRLQESEDTGSVLYEHFLWLVEEAEYEERRRRSFWA